MLNLFRKIFFLDKHVCPWWVAYSFDNPFRRLLHKPDKILLPYVKEGMTVVDIGCGMGFFSIEMAKMIGDKGMVISIDLQQKMLDILKKRAKKAGVTHRIYPRLCRQDDIGLSEKADFILNFWMVHEVPDKVKFFDQIKSSLKPGGRLLVVEPKFHVSQANFEKTVQTAQKIGLKLCSSPQISLSRSALLQKILKPMRADKHCPHFSRTDGCGEM